MDKDAFIKDEREEFLFMSLKKNAYVGQQQTNVGLDWKSST